MQVITIKCNVVNVEEIENVARVEMAALWSGQRSVCPKKSLICTSFAIVFGLHYEKRIQVKSTLPTLPYPVPRGTDNSTYTDSGSGVRVDKGEGSRGRSALWMCHQRFHGQKNRFQFLGASRDSHHVIIIFCCC